MSYRFDNRTKEQFKQDIKDCHKDELTIALSICQNIYNEKKIWPLLDTNGCDNSGEFLEDKNVTSDPDFIIDGVYTEITKSNTVCKKYFHEKLNKVNKALSDNSENNLVFVNGYNELISPLFISLNKKELFTFSEMAKKKYGVVGMPTRNGFISKQSLRYDISWFDGMWKELKDPTLECYTQYAKFIERIYGKDIV